MSTRRTLLSLALALLIGMCLALSSCLGSPTVPIPPPEPTRMVFNVDTTGGTAVFTYDADSSYSNAVVYVFNRDKGVGVITTAEADGSVAPTDPFAGDAGDNVVVTFELDSQLGSTCVVLQQGRSSAANECSQ